MYKALNIGGFNPYICDLLGVILDCANIRTRHIDEETTCFQHGPCEDVVKMLKRTVAPADPSLS